MKKYADLSTAIAMTALAFECKMDKGGVPYIMHCLHVMNAVKHLGYKTMMVAVMHDLVEDTRYTLKDLQDRNFNPLVIEGVDSMTHVEGESYSEYINRISLNNWIIPIKMADLQHNSDITRLKDVRQKDFDRLTKYARAYKFLEDVYVA